MRRFAGVVLPLVVLPLLLPTIQVAAAACQVREGDRIVVPAETLRVTWSWPGVAAGWTLILPPRVVMPAGLGGSDGFPDATLPLARGARARPVPMAVTPFAIVAGGCHPASTDVRLAFDGDAATTWDTVGAIPRSFAWFDLGQRRSLGAIRWLQTGATRLEIRLSSDGQAWSAVGRGRELGGGGWQTLPVERQARYVLFTVAPPVGAAQAGGLAEVAIHGPAQS
jgi:hypothetical protein